MGIGYVVRSLRRSPAFAIGASATVAVCIGATTAIFSVVYGVLMRQLPYRDVERVFWIWSDRPGRDRAPFNVPDFVDYRDSVRTLSGFAGYFAYSASLNDDAEAARVQGLRATANFFDVLGAAPRLGRLLQAADDRPGLDRVVVLAEPFWILRFGGDPRAIGRSLRLDGEPYTVVGVMSAGFATPIRDVVFVIPYSPDRVARRGARGSLNFMHAVGRLAGDATVTQAASELNALARQLRERFPVDNAAKRGVRVVAVIDGVAGQFRMVLATILAAAAAVLLVACANLASLMLARTAARARTVALQRALGASRWRVARHVLAEALAIALAGGAAGICLARLGVAGLLAIVPAGLPRSGDIRIDTGVLVFAGAISVLTGLLLGVVPALESGATDVRDALQGGGRGVTPGHAPLRQVLVGVEVAAAVVVLTALLLLAKSFANVQGVALGFDTEQVLSARISLPVQRFTDRGAIVRFQQALLEGLTESPGVRHAGVISLLPLSGLVSRVPFTIDGRPLARDAIPVAQYRLTSPGFFRAAGIPIQRGRVFDDRDTGAARPVAVVNGAFAARWLSGIDPIGARVLVNDNDTGPRPIEIVGIVGDVRQLSLDGEPTWDLYLPYAQLHPDNVGLAAGNMFLAVRTAGDPMLIAPTMVRELRRVDPEIAASQIQPLGRYVSNAVAPRRFSVLLMSAFGAAALVLAAIGIYAVIAHSIGQRTREIGIRLALGAGRRAIVRLVVGQGMRPVVAGLAAGAVLAFVASRPMASLLFGIPAHDVVTLVQVCAVVAIVALVACAVPALRVNPSLVSVLKSE